MAASVFSSKNHPNLVDIGSSKTKKLLFVYRNKWKHAKPSTSMPSDGTSSNVSKSKTPLRVSNLDVSELWISIRNTTELFATANARKHDC